MEYPTKNWVMMIVVIVLLVGWGSYVAGESIGLHKNLALEGYNDGYLNMVKGFIDKCYNTYNSSTYVRHWIDVGGKHIGIMYRCEYPNTTNYMNIKYSEGFYR